MANREKLGGHLQSRHWMARVLDRTYEQSNRLADWGYPYPVDDNGKSQRNSLQGPEYMRLMRKRTKQAGVTILDHSPALELLVDEKGAVAGASGLRRQKHDRWTVRARAVVIATGGCAFASTRTPSPPRSSTDLRQPTIGDRKSLRAAVGQHPRSVGGDADRDHLEALGVEVAQDAACGNTRNRVLGAASAVDDGDADATGGPGRIRGSHNLERLPP